MNEHPVARLPSLSHSYGIGSGHLSEMVCLHCSQGHSGFTLRLVLSSLSQPIHKLGAIEDTGPCDRRREQPHVHSQFLSELTQHLAFASLLFYANGKQLLGEKRVFLAYTVVLIHHWGNPRPEPWRHTAAGLVTLCLMSTSFLMWPSLLYCTLPVCLSSTHGPHCLKCPPPSVCI